MHLAKTKCSSGNPSQESSRLSLDQAFKKTNNIGDRPHWAATASFSFINTDKAIFGLFLSKIFWEWKMKYNLW